MADTRKPARRDADAGAMRIDPTLVSKLAQLLSDNELTEIEIADGDRRIKVTREPAPVIASAPAPVAASMVPAAPSPAAPAAAAAAPTAAPSAAEEDVGGTMVKSPMVGTAFLAAQPGAKPFVEVGDTVKAGDTLLIVEAMKVMNPITAPAAGVLKKLLVADAQPVEFDQPLAVIG